MNRIIMAGLLLLSLGASADAGNYFRLNQNTPMSNAPGTSGPLATAPVQTPIAKEPDPAPAPDPSPVATAEGLNTSPNVGDAATGRIVVTNFKGAPNFSFIGSQPDGIDIGQDGSFTGTYLAGGSYDFTVLAMDSGSDQLIFKDLTIDVGVGPVAATASPK